MKKILLLLIISLFWFSCELPNSGRMATIDFNFTQPDILKEAETSGVPDRIIPGETMTIVVIMYPDFEGDYSEEGSLPEVLDDILAQKETKTLTLNYSQTINSSGSLDNVEPGIWNFIVLTYNTTINLSSLNPYNSLTNIVKKGVEITSGINLIDLPLQLTQSITAQNVTDISYTNNSVGQVSTSETIYLSATGFQPGTCRITYDLTNANPETVVLLYSKEGYLIDATPTAGTFPYVYLTFSPTDSTYEIIIAVSNINPTIDSIPLGMSFYENDYVTDPTQNLTIAFYFNT